MASSALGVIGDCAWFPTGGSANGAVEALVVYDGSGEPALYAGGWFTGVGGVTAHRIARWNGMSWSPLAGTGANWVVNALGVFDPGDGASLYAGGGFTTIGGVTSSNLARWNGSQWISFGSDHPGGAVLALETISFDGATRLYAGGGFSSAGFVTLNRIGAWDGVEWTALGTGMNNSVHTIAFFDGGGGPAIYAGGTFTTAGGVEAKGIAKWDGNAWSPVGGGIAGGNARVNALKVHDDGGGSALFVAGSFTSAGGVEAYHIAKWNGTSWSAVGDEPLTIGGSISALEVFDDGRGPALYAGGFFTGLEWQFLRIARWDGAAWSALGAGIQGGSAEVRALRAWDDGHGPTLHVGGEFTNAGDVWAIRVARWRCEASGPTTPDLNNDGVVDGADLGILLNAWGMCDGCPADLNGDGVVDGADLGMLLNGWG